MRRTAAAKATSPYGVHPGVAMMQKWVAELKGKTGRSFEEWMSLIAKEGPKDEKLDDYVHDTVRKARLVVGRATDPERAWLARSAGAIKGIVNSIAASDIHGAHLALAVLDGNDWRGVVEQVRKRIDGALLGNMPPYQWPLKAAARRLLEAARKNRTENKSAISALRAE